MKSELERFKRKRNSRNKTEKKNSNNLYKVLNKTLFVIVISLVFMIVMKGNSGFKKWVYKEVYEKNISFTAFNSVYKKYFGNVIPFSETLAPVFNEKLEYKNVSKYLDGAKLEVSTNYLIPNQMSGIVVFVGEKDGYGKTVIVQQANGIDMWYGNINSVSIKLYDYIEKGTLIGEAKGDAIYLVYKKEGKVLDYEKYL